MFYHAYNGYMKYAFPADELKPISCKPRYRNTNDQYNIKMISNRFDFGTNDVLGDYVLTLVDSLDTLALMGDFEGFENGVKKVIEQVHFNLNHKIQVFEVTIRILGGLLSAHLLAINKDFGMKLNWYKNELLKLAEDLGKRLLPAFETPSKIPYARVNLKYGVPKHEIIETCTAGAGTLILEFGILSRLTGNPIYEEKAHEAFKKIWDMRFSNNLFGNSINVSEGEWFNDMMGLGAGLDSFFEYMLKAAILFNNDEYLDWFETTYLSILKYNRDTTGLFYLNIKASHNKVHNTWIDSLSAFFPGLQVLAGDIESAIRAHLVYFNIWAKYHSLPERFDLTQYQSIMHHYPLRPELFESTYFLYQATRDPFYLKVGEILLNDLETFTRTKCGFASISNVSTKDLDDKMESFFLSETLKYLYLLFDEENQINKMDSNFVFNTEGHLLLFPESYVDVFKDSLNSTKKWKLKCQKFKPKLPFVSNIVSRPEYDFVRNIIRDSSTKFHFPGQCSVPFINTPLDHYKRRKVFEFDELPIVLKNTLMSKLEERHKIKEISHITDIIDVKIDFKSTNFTTYLKVNGVQSMFGPMFTYKSEAMNIKFIDNSFGCDHYNQTDINDSLNKIVIVSRGQCTIIEKVVHAQNAGAKVVLIYNYNEELFTPYGSTSDDKEVNYVIEIPSAIITKHSSDLLFSYWTSNSQLNVSVVKPLFSDDLHLYH